MLTIAKKNNTKIASVSEENIISPSGISSVLKVFSRKSKNNCIANRAKIMMAYFICFRPVFWYAEIESANSKRDIIPILIEIKFSIPWYRLLWKKLKK